MLGTRRFHDTALDLYCGDFRFFVADAIVCGKEDAQEDLPCEAVIPMAMGQSGFLTESLRGAQGLCVRHVSFAPFIGLLSGQKEGGARAAMEEVRSFLAARPPIKRITFVLDNKEDYGVFQKALYDTFTVTESGKHAP